MYGQTPLMKAWASGDMDIVNAILSCTIPPGLNVQDSCGFTPLMYAVMETEPSKDFVTTFEGFLSLPDLDVNIQDAVSCSTALMHAARTSPIPDAVLPPLLSHPKIEVNVRNALGHTALMSAVLSLKGGVAKHLLSHPSIDPNLPNASGQTPLMAAWWEGKVQIADAIFSHPSCSVNAQDSRGRTALIYAILRIILTSSVWWGEGDAWPALRRLLSHPDLDLNARDETGNTALLAASFASNPVVLNALLLDPRVDVTMRDNNGRTALMSLISSCRMVHGGVIWAPNPQAYRLLLTHPNIDCDTPDGEGLTPLMAAWIHGQLEIAQALLLRKLQSINAQSASGRTALMYAAPGLPRNHPSWSAFPYTFSALLCYSDLDVNKQDKEGNTALMYAVRDGTPNEASMLLGHSKIDINLRNNYGRTALTLALQRSRMRSVARDLLARPDIDCNSVDEGGRSTLMEAWATRDYDIITTVLRHAPAPSTTSHPLLQAACRAESLEPEFLIRELESILASPAVDINMRDREGNTTLIDVAQTKFYGGDLLSSILSRPEVNVNLPNRRGQTALAVAIMHCNFSAVRNLLAHPEIDINAADGDGTTPLMEACKHGLLECVELLLGHAKPCDVNAQDHRGRTALTLAGTSSGPQGNIDDPAIDAILTALLSTPDIDVNIPDQNGNMALAHMAQDYIVSDVSWTTLLDHPYTEVNARNNEGRTALALAIMHWYAPAKIEHLLFHPRIDCNVADCNGRTPFMEACRFGVVDTVQAMLQHGSVDLTLRDKGGLSAFDHARNYPEVLELLVYDRVVGEGSEAQKNDNSSAI